MADLSYPAVLIEALKSSARVVAPNLTDNLENELSSGELFVNLLSSENGLSTKAPLNADEIWLRIKERLENVFGPNLINWNLAKLDSPMSRANSGGNIRRESFRPIPPSSKRTDNPKLRDSLLTMTKNTLNPLTSQDQETNQDQLFVGLLALYVCCVNDQRADVYNELLSLNDKQQFMIGKVFTYMLGVYIIKSVESTKSYYICVIMPVS